MNILFLTTSYPEFQGDSHGTWVHNIATGLAKSGHNIKIIAPSSKKSLLNEITDGVTIERFRYSIKNWEGIGYGPGIMPNLKNNKLLYFILPFFLISYILKTIKNIRKYDVLHCHFVISGLIGHIASKITGRNIKIITSFYGNDLSHCKKFMFLYKIYLKQSYGFIAISKDMKERLINELHIPSNKIIINYLGIDTEKFAYKKPLKNSETVFLTVARFVEKKGIEYSIEACNILKNKGIIFKYYIIGDGPLKGRYEYLIKKYNLQKYISIINNYESQEPRKLVKDYFDLADIFLLSSIVDNNDYGGTPVVLSEALAMGIPCIASDDCGNKDVVLDNKTGYIVKEKDVEGLSEAMIKLASDFELLKSFSKAGYQHIINSFNNKDQCRKLLYLYEEAINDGE